MAEYDARTDAALTRLVATLPANAAQLLLGQLDEALAERARRPLCSRKRPSQESAHTLPSARFEASPRPMAMGTTSIPWPGNA